MAHFTLLVEYRNWLRPQIFATIGMHRSDRNRRVNVSENGRHHFPPLIDLGQHAIGLQAMIKRDGLGCPTGWANFGLRGIFQNASNAMGIESRRNNTARISPLG